MRFYFLGIGGIGMSALARYFKQRGDDVMGYDKTPSPLTHELEQEGMQIHYEDNVDLIPDGIDMVVYTPAIPTDLREFVHLKQSGLPIMKRSQMLGELTKGKKCIAVAGTHGKTSTSSMIAHVLNMSSKGCSAFLGGISKNLNSNMLVNTQSEFVVVEADEYDRSFLQLHPFASVITATDPDHLDIYGTYENLLLAFNQYADQTEEGGFLLTKDVLNIETTNSFQRATYTANGVDADYYAVNIRTHKGDVYFDLRTPERVLYDMQLTNSSLYNVENAVAAAAVSFFCGLNEQEVREGLKTFSGVNRRFDYRINTSKIVFIDDYAHHPNEISATLSSIRNMFPGKRVVGVFQPHLYSRTKDLAAEFAKSLEDLDEIIMLDIYPAREKPIPGVTSKLILQKINKMEKYLCSKEQLAEVVVALCPDVVVTLGAGDIDRLVPELEATLKQEYGIN